MNTWADLNHLQTGRYGEDFAKMAFGRAGFDVFSPEVDDKGIDFVLRVDGDVPLLRRPGQDGPVEEHYVSCARKVPAHPEPATGAGHRRCG